ncbi:sensor domain-containing diguanylate cyclase [Actinoplanes sp. LDG1-06]|uniref:Sensor domain-containing diguanylate cyclase n=1 Tax=Paractinoplanes ovalisporus TaxID=2810368 RepID=A0ABS2AQB0_9ACTN|nr:sensor domain-containing diguanylate cyclase [Actinoplanes ovalisporus]MBM2621379.1 sensor domain-containing diguanylate cyclase [Actinoplanes ovalisporus]
MSVSTSAGVAGAVLGADPQDALVADLVSFMTKDTPSVQHVLELSEPHLRTAAGLTAATVFELNAETGMLVTARVGEPGSRDLFVAGKVLRQAAGAKPAVSGEQMPVRLRIGGQTVGVLLLTGSDLGVLRPDVLAALALHVATTLQGLAAERQRQFLTHSSTTVRRLFEEGMAAASVEAAGRVLAASAADGFRTEHGAVCLTDADGTIRYVHAVNLPDGDDQLGGLVGRSAADSPVWQAIQDGRATLVADSATAQVQPGGLVRLMNLKAYVAMPLMSAQGPIGLIMIGDSTATRTWTSQDRILAEQLSVEGALIVDSAGMRQAAQAHVAELSHQAFHDSLTGLPNRTHLIEQAEQAVLQAASAHRRVAMMMLDLNGFKQVNDTAGHQAGDVLLQQVSQRLLGAVRDDDVVARLGGDEFAILLTHDPDESIANAVAARICERLRQPFTIEGREVTIGGSVGFALYPDDATGYEALIKGADEAMYVAKRDTKHSGGGYRRFS